jgi:hypothetical protein
MFSRLLSAGAVAVERETQQPVNLAAVAVVVVSHSDTSQQ